MIERRMLKNLDFILILTVAIIMVMSLVVIASATQANIGEGADPYYYVKRQGLVICAGLVALVVFLALDYHTLVQYANYIYAANLGLLLAVLALAKDVKGAGRWIDLGFFRLQPSEFAKIFLIITLANYLANTAGEMEKLSDLFPLLLHVAVPMLLIMLQPDLGTALVLLAILMGMMFVAGIKIQHLLTLVLAGVAALPFLWNFLKDYQKIRLLVFLDPSIDPTGSGYHVIQSMIAIGSGRLTGQGLFAGPQNQLNFLPEQHTDFIFSVVGEEMGFVGASLLLLLYFILIYRGIHIALHARDLLGTLLAVGVVSMLVFQILVNVGMTIGIMPVTGIPLPLFSYGGSSLLSTLLGIGLLLNVGMRRQKILF
ncbi:MAG: rod shape-determining protein RodA [bacterium]|nr:rod shape-determining protein RodA [Bacillota bacterium]